MASRFDDDSVTRAHPQVYGAECDPAATSLKDRHWASELALDFKRSCPTDRCGLADADTADEGELMVTSQQQSRQAPDLLDVLTQAALKRLTDVRFLGEGAQPRCDFLCTP